MNTKVITLFVPKNLTKTLEKQIINDGYGMKGKSLWIREAIEEFLNLPNFIELSVLDNQFNDLSDSLSIRITPALDERLKEAVINVRKHFPESEGVKSHIVRASILQRLIKVRLSIVEG